LGPLKTGIFLQAGLDCQHHIDPVQEIRLCAQRLEWLTRSRLAVTLLFPIVIPGRRDAANPESITTIVSMDSRQPLRGFQNDE
jgi:hypothetical protein